MLYHLSQEEFSDIALAVNNYFVNIKTTHRFSGVKKASY